jgi:hypothetical protein
MIIWNNISPASSYLDDVRSSIGEGLVRVCSVHLLFFRSWLLVYLSEEAIDWLSMRRSRSLLLVNYIARSDIFNTLFWWWRIESLCLFGGFLRPMFFKWVLDLIVRVVFSVFKVIFGKAVCRCPFSLLSSQCNLQTPAAAVDVRRMKMIDLVFYVLLLFLRLFYVYCPSFIPVFVFHEIYQMFFRKGNTLIFQLLHWLLHIVIPYYKHKHNGLSNLKNKVLSQRRRR